MTPLEPKLKCPASQALKALRSKLGPKKEPQNSTNSKHHKSCSYHENLLLSIVVGKDSVSITSC